MILCVETPLEFSAYVKVAYAHGVPRRHYVDA
jgi:hypothetical protein